MMNKDLFTYSFRHTNLNKFVNINHFTLTSHDIHKVELEVLRTVLQSTFEVGGYIDGLSNAVLLDALRSRWNFFVILSTSIHSSS